MVIDSTSTLAQVEAAYDDNASYAQNNSPDQCRQFITACRILLRRMPKAAGQRDSHLQTNTDLIEKAIGRAELWLQSNDTGAGSNEPRITRVDFSDNCR